MKTVVRSILTTQNQLHFTWFFSAFTLTWNDPDGSQLDESK